MRTSLLPIATLWRREMVRFFRQRNRVVGALGTPLLFWIVLGSGLGASFRAPGMEGVNYLVYFYPGTIVLVVLFTAVFSTISVIEDRQRGFLQAVLVSPAPRWSLVIGNVLGGTTVAFVQGMVMVLLAPFLYIPQTAASVLLTAVSIFTLGVALTGLGFSFAWRTDSAQGFHAVMNLILFPLWMLSGAVFPLEKAPEWLAVVSRVNPVSYSVTALREGLAGHAGLPLAVSALFALAALAASVLVVRGDSS